jgi:hypothetical protein
MKKRIQFLLIVCLSLGVFSNTSFAQTNYTYAMEGFDQTGVWPTSAAASDAGIAAATGTWKVNNAYRKTTASSLYDGYGDLYIKSAGYLISPYLPNGVDSVTFYARSSGSGARTITLQKSTDGTTFTDVATLSVANGTYALCSYKIHDGSAQYIKLIAGTAGDVLIDDITMTIASNTVITLSSTALTDFGSVVTGSTSSTSANYTVGGTAIPSALVAKAPTNFQVSTDNINFADSVSITSAADSSVAATTIYVRFAPVSAAGSVSGTITNKGGIISKSVTVSGVAIAAEPTAQSAITFGTVTGTSAVVNFSGGNGAYRILVAKRDTAVTWKPIDGISVSGVSANFASAQDQSDDGDMVVYTGSGNTVTVTGLSVATTYYFAVYEFNVGTANSQNYLTASPGTGIQTTLEVPTLSADLSSISFGNMLIDSTSGEKVYSLSGKFLSPSDGSITVTAPSGFAISTTSGSGFSSSLALPYNSATLSATPVYVHFYPTSLSAYSGTIDNSGGSAAVSITLSGTGVDSATFAIQTIYVSPTGSEDTGKGTFDSPYKSVANSALKLRAGGVLILRGGVYNPDSIVIKDATMHNLTFKAYPGETPTIRHGSYDGIILYASYCTIDGIAADSAVHNGIHIMGHYNVIKNCDFHHNGDAGLKLGAHLEYKYPRCDSIINCDAHDNYDSGTNGGNADGFAAKWAVGSGNYFYGCRAWNNADDGWDLWMADSTIVIENCWCIANGTVPAHTAAAGNGNGFKVGGNKVCVHHEVKNCLALYGYGSSGGKGFDQNSNAAGHTILNCTSYNNEFLDFNFPLAATAGENIIKNCIAYLSTSKPALISIKSGDVTNDSWLTGFSVSAADFVSLDTAGLRGARQSDGSLPVVTFGHLKSTSAFINTGVDVGLTYNGSAPDLGCFEYSSASTAVNSAETASSQPAKFQLNQNYPNPFNPSTIISFTVEQKGIATLKVYDVLGREVTELFNGQVQPGQTYAKEFNAARFASGIYFSVLQTGSQREVKKMVFMK